LIPNPHSALHIYEADKKCAAVCTLMSQNGFRFDVDRAAVYIDKLKGLESDALTRAESAINRPLKRTKTGGISVKDMHGAFFFDLGAPVLKRSELTGKASIDVNALRAYSVCADPALRYLALAILDRRKAQKIRSTYIQKIILDADGRVHPTWHNAGPITGRFSCSGPSFMQLPRGASDPTYQESNGKVVEPWGGVRSLYVPDPGYVIVGFDKSQLELRVAAYTTGCPAYIAAIESGDVHSHNAKLVFGQAFIDELNETKRIKASDPKFKGTVLYVKIRTQAKTFIFALNYMAGAETIYAQCIAAGLQVKLRGIQAVLNKLHRQYKHYYDWQAENLLKIKACGYVYSPIMQRARWVGFDPQPTECANFPIQAGAADVMNTELPLLHAAQQKYFPKAKLLAQVHDAVYSEVPRAEADSYVAMLEDTCQQEFSISTSGSEFKVRFPIDIDVSERWK